MNPADENPKIKKESGDTRQVLSEPIIKHAMTHGFGLLAMGHPQEMGAFVNCALKLLGKNKGEPSMAVGSPTLTLPEYQDQGRTVLLPIDPRAPKLFACLNETGGYTFMLAEEY